MTGNVARCECKGLVKPDIVFFGENLPAKFFDSLKDVRNLHPIYWIFLLFVD